MRTPLLNKKITSYIGYGLYIFTLQYFIVQLIVALAWAPVRYNIKINAISDLGYRTCGITGGRYICSPLHLAMNISFVVLGLSMVIGSFLILHNYRKFILKLALLVMAVGGLGGIIVGLFPEYSPDHIHTLGASIALGFSCISLVLLNLFFEFNNLFLGIVSRLLALVSFTAAILFVRHTYWIFGPGGVEKLVSYPQTLWLIGFGIHNIYRLRQNAHTNSPAPLPEPTSSA